MLSQLLVRYFTPSVRSKGEAYFKAGVVRRLDTSEDGIITASVLGTSEYQVAFDIEKGKKKWTVYSACTCPYSEDYNSFCKHIWAALLAAEKHGLIGRPAPKATLYLDEFLIEDASDRLQVPAARASTIVRASPTLAEIEDAIAQTWANKKAGVSVRALPAPPPPTPPAWERLINSLAHRSAYAAPGDSVGASVEPYYVLDLQQHPRNRALCIVVQQRPKTPTGRLGAFKKLKLKGGDLGWLKSDLDRRICLMLAGASAVADSMGYGSIYRYSYSGADEYHAPVAILDSLLPLLNETGRFLYRRNRQHEPTPLLVELGRPWELILESVPSEGKSEFKLQPVFRREGERRPARDVQIVAHGEPGCCLIGHTLSRVRFHGCPEWIEELSSRDTPSIPAEQIPRLLARFAEVNACPPIEWPADLGVTQITELAPRPNLRLRYDEKNSWSRFADAEVAFRYGETTVAAHQSRRVVFEPQDRRQIVRDVDAEAGHLARAAELGVHKSPNGTPRIEVKRIPNVVCALLNEGWEVTGNKAIFRKAGKVSIDVTSGIDWFELQGAVDFDGLVATLPDLLAAYRKGERFVRLGDGTMGVLPEEWLARHGAMLELGAARKGGLRFARTQIGLLDALLAQLPEARFDQTLAAARKRLAAFEGVKPQAAPEGFNGMLRPYQEVGLGWLGFLCEFGFGGCLADDMGLGKTVEMLARLDAVHREHQSGVSLVVVPKSLVFNWSREAARFAPGLRILDYTGLDRRAGAFTDYDVVITTYGTLRRDIEPLSKQQFHYVILDEAQAIKNPNSQSAKAVRLLQGEHRLVMTGTPVENHLGDLWSLFEFLNPGMLGAYAAFQNAFGKSGGKTNGQRRENGDHLAPLHRMLRPFILRRTKEQVAPELPERNEQTIECELSPAQRGHYDELRDYYRANLLGRVEREGLNKSKVYVLEALLRLRQAACHPGLIDPAKQHLDCAKLDALLPMLEELREEGHKALVFSQFVSFLDILRARLDAAKVRYEYLDGQTTDRAARVDRFQQDSELRLFLISLKAGGTGLNLTAADYVFILDPWWNPAVEAQAIDRTHRIGQTKKVIAYRLIARDTVESRILELQRNKRDLAGAIIGEANSLISDLTREDLAMLLS